MNLDLLPPPPAEARFDREQNTWILSRYADVYAALREPVLRQVSTGGEFFASDDVSRHTQMHEEVQADMVRMVSAEWRRQMEASASAVIERLPSDQPIDIVKSVIEPWSASVLLALSDMEPAYVRRLTKLAGRMFNPTTQRSKASPLAPLSSRLRSLQRRRAQEEMGRIWKTQNVTMGKSMLTGITQTLPGFLTTSWLALMQHPDQAALLLASPELAPNAVEELLRYAGIVHSLPRRAAADVRIGETQIAKGDHVLLRLSSANFDPERFPEPEKLDITRRAIGHVGLGTGPHICVGALLVRMATATITPVFFAAGPVLELKRPILWRTDETLRWPAALYVRFRSRRTGRG